MAGGDSEEEAVDCHEAAGPHRVRASQREGVEANDTRERSRRRGCGTNKAGSRHFCALKVDAAKLAAGEVAAMQEGPAEVVDVGAPKEEDPVKHAAVECPPAQVEVTHCHTTPHAREREVRRGDREGHSRLTCGTRAQGLSR